MFPRLPPCSCIWTSRVEIFSRFNNPWVYTNCKGNPNPFLLQHITLENNVDVNIYSVQQRFFQEWGTRHYQTLCLETRSHCGSVAISKEEQQNRLLLYHKWALLLARAGRLTGYLMRQKRWDNWTSTFFLSEEERRRRRRSFSHELCQVSWNN